MDKANIIVVSLTEELELQTKVFTKRTKFDILNMLWSGQKLAVYTLNGNDELVRTLLDHENIKDDDGLFQGTIVLELLNNNWITPRKWDEQWEKEIIDILKEQRNKSLRTQNKTMEEILFMQISEITGITIDDLQALAEANKDTPKIETLANINQGQILEVTWVPWLEWLQWLFYAQNTNDGAIFLASILERDTALYLDTEMVELTNTNTRNNVIYYYSDWRKEQQRIINNIDLRPSNITKSQIGKETMSYLE